MIDPPYSFQVSHEAVARVCDPRAEERHPGGRHRHRRGRGHEHAPQDGHHDPEEQGPRQARPTLHQGEQYSVRTNQNILAIELSQIPLYTRVLMYQ